MITLLIACAAFVLGGLAGVALCVDALKGDR